MLSNPARPDELPCACDGLQLPLESTPNNVGPKLSLLQMHDMSRPQPVAAIASNAGYCQSYQLS